MFVCFPRWCQLSKVPNCPLFIAVPNCPLLVRKELQGAQNPCFHNYTFVDRNPYSFLFKVSNCLEVFSQILTWLSIYLVLGVLRSPRRGKVNAEMWFHLLQEREEWSRMFNSLSGMHAFGAHMCTCRWDEICREHAHMPNTHGVWEEGRVVVVVVGLCAHCNIKGCIHHQIPALTTFYGGRATAAAFMARHFYWLQSRARIDLFKSRESRAGKGHPVLAVWRWDMKLDVMWRFMGSWWEMWKCENGGLRLGGAPGQAGVKSTGIGLSGIVILGPSKDKLSIAAT